VKNSPTARPRHRRRSLVVIVAAVASVTAAATWTGGTWSALALGTTTTSSNSGGLATTTTAPTPGSTTTTHPPPQPPPTFDTTTTTQRSALPIPTTAPAAPSTSAVPAPASPTTTSPAKGASTQPTVSPGPKADVITPDVQALINSIKRTGASSTSKLLDALRALDDFGLTAQEQALIGFGHFPVAGTAAYNDDFLMPRHGPPFHLHQGNDIWAATGTPIRAPFDGSVRYSDGGLGGLGVYLTMPDGTYFYNAHIAATVRGLNSGSSVKQGQVIGFVGATGNATGGPPHDHFEIHPKGGPAVNPKPILDGWLADALAQVPALVAAYRGNAPAALVSTGLTRRFDESGGMFSAPLRPSAGPLLWASSVSPAGGTVRMAQVEAEGAMSQIDWGQVTAARLADVAAWQQADEVARNLLQPLTPGRLEGLL
jgi:murein DD-endopeptidase MepM/ murein hydrolase activator NlpD